MGLSSKNKIICNEKESIATITINAPDKMNAIELEMWAEIHKVMSMTKKFIGIYSNISNNYNIILLN